MTRLVVYILVSLVIALGAAWLIALPGTLTIEVAGYRLQPGLGVTGAALLALILLAIIVWAIVRRLIEAPRRLARAAAARRVKTGFDALADGYIALQAGDPSRARTLARDARTRLPESPAAMLLEAQAELATGDMAAAREHYRALIGNPKTALAALTGLYDQARAQGRADAALTFARKAVKLAPGLAWAQTAVFDDLTRRGDWDAALETVTARPATTREQKARKRRDQAVLLAATATAAQPTDPDKAYRDAMSALKFDADFVPPALIAARVLIDKGEVRKAQSLLRRLWRATGHPHVALLYANAQPGASAVERLKRLRELIEGSEPTLASALVLARAAIDAFEWSLARNALAPYIAGEPTQQVCSLMAEIEEGQSGDQGKARQWLARAVRAPRDATWVADGIVSDDWEPVSPVTGRLDAFEWKAPLRLAATDRPAAAKLPAADPKPGPAPLPSASAASGE